MIQSGRNQPPKNQEKNLPNLSERVENDTNFLQENSSNESDAPDVSNTGDDVIVPEISQSDANEMKG